MTGVIYARYSSDNQREESIEGQIRECTAFAEKNGITIVRSYIDRAFSAKTDNRPEFLQMIKDSSQKAFDVIIVWKLDRFSRNRVDSAKYKTILKKNGVKVVSATEIISNGAEGIILESVLEAIAEYYSADLSEKVSRGMTENALKCKYNGGASVPLGYKIDEERHYQIDPAMAPVVLEIFERYANGESIKVITTDLNRRGLTTSRGVPFNKNSLHNMLQNTNYIGVYHYRDIVIPGGVPAIVSKEIFDAAKERMEKNRHAPARNKADERYILTTKLFCGECKSMLLGESGINNKNVKYRYYKCASAKKRKCKLKSVRKDAIENYVVNNAVNSLKDKKRMDNIIAAILDELKKENTVIPSLEIQLKTVQKSIDNLVKAIEDGVYTRSTKQRLEELENKENEIQLSIQNEKLNNPVLTADQIRFTLNKFVNLDLKVQKNREMIVDSLVGSVVIFDDGTVILTLNFRGEPIVSTLDEIISAADSCSDIDCLGSP